MFLQQTVEIDGKHKERGKYCILTTRLPGRPDTHLLKIKISLSSKTHLLKGLYVVNNGLIVLQYIKFVYTVIHLSTVQMERVDDVLTRGKRMMERQSGV